MMKNRETTEILPPTDVHSSPYQDVTPEVGQWFWINLPNSSLEKMTQAPSGFTHLVCVVHLGSNYAEVKTMRVDGCYHNDRILYDDFSELRYEYLAWAPLLLACEDFYAGKWEDKRKMSPHEWEMAHGIRWW